MRRGFEFSFSWLFSLIVGALILVLAVYGVSTWVGQERTVGDSESAQALSGLLSPLQTSGESSFRPNPIVFPQPTELTLGCINGASTIQTRALSQIGRNTAPGYAQETAGIMLFGNTTMQGTRLYSLVVPFSLPYKISELVVIWTDPLCLVQAPESVMHTFGSDNQSVRFVDNVISCGKGSRIICFEDVHGCTVIVDQFLKRVTTGGKSMYYEGALLYGALVASPPLYECQVASLMRITEGLTVLYADTSELISARSNGCSAAIGTSLASYRQLVHLTNNSKQLAHIAEQAETLDHEERASVCSLWRNI